MRTLLFLAVSIISFSSLAQKVSALEENQSFSTGSHKSIVVNIPNGTKEGVEEALKREMKDYGGSFDESKGEYTAKGASLKSMGEKPFDVYAKIIQVGDVFKVAFAVDLGGAYMNSSDHSAQFRVIQARAIKFAETAGTASVNGELKIENKKLSAFKKEQAANEKAIKKSEKAIEDAKKKIAEEEKKIAESKSKLEKATEDVKKQEEVVKALEKKK